MDRISDRCVLPLSSTHIALSSTHIVEAEAAARRRLGRRLELVRLRLEDRLALHHGKAESLRTKQRVLRES